MPEPAVIELNFGAVLAGLVVWSPERAVYALARNGNPIPRESLDGQALEELRHRGRIRVVDTRVEVVPGGE